MVIIKRYKKLISVMLLIFIMLPTFSFNNISYAGKTYIDQNEIDIPKITPALRSEMINDLKAWLNQIENICGNEPIINLKYLNDNKTSYESNYFKIAMPSDSSGNGRIVYTYSPYGSIDFEYQVLNADGTSTEYPITFNLYAYRETIDDNGKIINEANSLLTSSSASNYVITEDDEFCGYMMSVISDYYTYTNQELRISASINSSEGIISAEKTLISSFDPSGAGAGNVKLVDKTGETTFWDVLKKIWKFISAPKEWVKNVIASLLNGLLLALGDGIVTLVSNAVGEPVTIDKVIFGEIDKLSVNFWNKVSADDGQSTQSVLKDSVSYWYNILSEIAIIVYLVSLLIVGIKVLLASTGESKAKYKTVLLSWVTGIMILLMFPYVMKYMVRLNDTIVTLIGQDPDLVISAEPTPEIHDKDVDGLSSHYGESDFVSSINPSFNFSNPDSHRDIMLYIRFLAGDLDDMGLTFVYYVIIGELLVILWVYYKRLFMMAFLVTIFPLVAMMYIVEKLTSGSSHSFSTWFKEFIILVFTQTFHAATYVIIVNAGIESYIKTENWLFMLMCVIFLFQGEKLLRSIFGMRSSANTISDLASAELAGYGAVKSFGKILQKDKSKDPEEKEEEEANKKVEQGKDAQAKRNISEASSSNSNDEDSDDDSSSRALPSGGGENESNTSVSTDPEDAQRSSMQNLELAENLVKARALHKRNRGKRNILQKTTSVAFKSLGTITGAAFGAAKGDVGEAIKYGVVGKELGGIAAMPVKGAIKGISSAYNGKKFKKQIRNGDFDKDLKDIGFDIDAVGDTETQQMFREALAKAGSSYAGGRDGEMKLLKVVNKKRKKQQNESRNS